MVVNPGSISDSQVILGFDIGSVSVNMALLCSDSHVLQTAYVRHKGQPLLTIMDMLDDLSSSPFSHRITQIMGTGSARAILSELLNAQTVNEVIAQAKATSFLYKQVRTIIEIGGEDSKLICLDWDESLNMICVQDFAMNSICAAGTGSFLDQQATRLGFSIEEFGSLALKSNIPPRIAGRCSVFAKSDMIHLQQEATPDYDIVAGLCFAMARNFKGSIGRGKTFTKPISFQGGVAANKGMIRAFESVLKLEPGELIIPEHFGAMGAIGACLLHIHNTIGKKKDSTPVPLNILKLIGRLKDYLKHPSYHKKALPPLRKNTASNFIEKTASPGITNPLSLSIDNAQGITTDSISPKTRQNPGLLTSKISSLKTIWTHGRQTGAYLGIDIGSISTNVVAIDELGHVLAKRYLMTAGRPIEAVRQGLDEIGREIGEQIKVLGVGTTGSGRYLIADFVGGDIVKNEITAQARAAASIDKDVDTIFEIGGQDSKYIRLANGAVIDFEMNKVCAAGTGSFLEEQAEKLDIQIKEEFGSIALKAEAPVSLGERCTVFMESDLVNHQQQGALKQNLIAGLAYSICYNYLNRVVGDRSIGQKIFFQGGVAFNQAVITAFEKVLGKTIIVPPHHEVTGAIGVALIAKEKKSWAKTGFKGFDLSHRPYSVESFECKGCSNICQVRKVIVVGEDPLFYGSRCERFDVKKKRKERVDIPDLFAEREEHLLKGYFPPPNSKNGPRIGLPMALFFHELVPLWKTFFEQLGCEVILSERTNKPIIDQGLQAIVAETCFPIKVAHGHILDLIKKKVDFIFLPSIISMPRDNEAEGGHVGSNFNCPYVQTIPYTIQSAFNLQKHGIKLINPVVRLNCGEKYISNVLLKVGKALGFKSYMVREAIYMALTSQTRFYETISKRGKDILSGLPAHQKAMVIVSRPYNGCDQGINLQIPKIFRELGLTVLPLDFLPLQQVDIAQDWPNMYWRYGRRILAAAEIIRQDPRLFAVYITNFGCGPDSFITKFFSKKMAGKPYLQMEIDEHSADAGAITRCEAFADSLENLDKEIRPKKPKVKQIHLNDRKRLLYIPYMCDHAHVIQAAFESSGVRARVIDESREETQILGRKYTSGKECYPCIVTTGDMVKTVKCPEFDPEDSAFFMPSGDGPCRFGQYNMFHRLVLDELGYPEVPIYSPMQGERFYKELGFAGDGFIRRAWQGVIAADLLDKWLRYTRPYEVNPGEAEKVYMEALTDVCHAIRLKKILFPIIKKIPEKLQEVKVNRSNPKPVVGIVGEIFVRSNRFSNRHIVTEIEKLGGEVWLPTIGEWFLYINYTSKRRSIWNRNFKRFCSIFIKDVIQRKDEVKLTRIFKDLLPYAHDPSIKTILKYSEPYLHETFEGEAILSVGKAIDFTHKGICGIINIMPFTCMPGTITNAILKRVREDRNLFPYLNMAYDGQEQSNTLTRLEAFMHQAHQYMERQAPSESRFSV